MIVRGSFSTATFCLPAIASLNINIPGEPSHLPLKRCQHVKIVQVLLTLESDVVVAALAADTRSVGSRGVL